MKVEQPLKKLLNCSQCTEWAWKFGPGAASTHLIKSKKKMVEEKNHGERCRESVIFVPLISLCFLVCYCYDPSKSKNQVKVKISYRRESAKHTACLCARTIYETFKSLSFSVSV